MKTMLAVAFVTILMCGPAHAQSMSCVPVICNFILSGGTICLKLSGQSKDAIIKKADYAEIVNRGAEKPALRRWPPWWRGFAHNPPATQ